MKMFVIAAFLFAAVSLPAQAQRERLQDLNTMSQQQIAEELRWNQQLRTCTDQITHTLVRNHGILEFAARGDARRWCLNNLPRNPSAR